MRQECARNVLWHRLSCSPLTVGTKRLLGASYPDGTTRVLDNGTYRCVLREKHKTASLKKPLT